MKFTDPHPLTQQQQQLSNRSPTKLIRTHSKGNAQLPPTISLLLTLTGNAYLNLSIQKHVTLYQINNTRTQQPHTTLTHNTHTTLTYNAHI